MNPGVEVWPRSGAKIQIPYRVAGSLRFSGMFPQEGLSGMVMNLCYVAILDTYIAYQSWMAIVICL